VRDWVAWHAAYDDPSSPLSVRLRLVCEHLSCALDQASPGPVRLISLCAGQGRDVLGVLPGHPRRQDVSALLVEANPHLAAQARHRAADAGLSGVEVREADAGRLASFADALPADVLLLCGIFGNVSTSDIQRTVEAAPAMCAPGAVVVWTRHRRTPDITSQIREWFCASGFDEVAFDAPDTDSLTSVGVHRLADAPEASPPGEPLFTFTFAEA
jgi:ubiquinone/menaquinone biosynthesis C-methylase UbiE